MPGDVNHAAERETEAGLYAQHRARLVCFAAAVVGPADAADVVGDAMLSLLKSGRLREAGQPVGLMYRAVLAKGRSLQRSAFRRRARERRFAADWIEHEPDFMPEVIDAVIGLSSRQRACVFLTYWEDLAPVDVAERLGIGEGTVKRYLARARARLREVLDG